MNGSIVVPLYVYPSVGAWDPVYTAAASYPTVQFTAVVNVHSGPGEGALPSTDYGNGIKILNSFANIRTIGYVSTLWGERNLSTVLDEVATYSFWSDYDSSFALDGIFVDETPTEFSTNYVSYLESITQAVHGSPGLKEGYIVHNPGTLPQPEYLTGSASDTMGYSRPNLTVVLENTYMYWSMNKAELAEMTKTYNREKLALLLHSVPGLSSVSAEMTMRELLAIGHSVWLTSSDNYTDLDANFSKFIDRLAALLS